MHTLRYISRAIFAAGALGLLLIAMTRFRSLPNDTAHHVLMNLSFVVMSLVIGIMQFEQSFIENNMRLLNYHWGRALFALFLTSISCAGHQKTYIQVVVAVYFFFAGCGFLCLAIADRHTDQVQDVIDTDMLAVKMLEVPSDPLIDATEHVIE